MSFASRWGFGSNPTPVLESAININTNLGSLLGSSPKKTLRVYVLSNPDCFIIHHQFDSKKPILQIERKENGPGKITRLKEPELHELLKGFLASADGFILVGIVKTPTGKCTYDNNNISGVYLCVATDCRVVGKINQHEIRCITETAFLPFGNRYYSLKVNDMNEFVEKQNMEKSHSEIRRWLNSNSFYYSTTYNLTVKAQEQYNQRTKSGKEGQSPAQASGYLISQVDKRFFWNRHAIHFFIKNNLSEFIVPIMKGFVQISSCRVNQQDLDLTLISRLSCLRTGTRYNARGVNDDGNVANFVETEQILSSQNRIASFVTIRGSVPVFWEEKFVRGKYRTIISRGREATGPAFVKHFEDIMKVYGNQCIVNLLNPTIESEKTLMDAFEEQLKDAKFNPNKVRYYSYKNGMKENTIGPLPLDELEGNLLTFGSFILDQDGNLLLTQKGAFRVNCHDCLDRTNVSQSSISLRALRMALHHLSIVPLDQSPESLTAFNEAAKDMWINNGDALSFAYTGTGALKSAVVKTGKMTWGGFVDDSVKLVKRSYQSIYRDSEKQEIIDQFLGISNSISAEEIEEEKDFLQVQLRDREHDYTIHKEITVFVGTWNIGGQAPKGEPLGGWLGNLNPSPSEPLIYVIAFEEVVELNTKSAWNADETNGQLWHNQILAFLSSWHTKKFIILRTYQLVGIVLTIFAPESEIHNFRDVCSEIAKVGFKGIAGNKGCVSIRFDYYDTSFCFCAVHLAAGQQAVDERNRDYSDIINTTSFRTSKGRKTILEHDHVFFFGDLNYRLNADYGEVRTMISKRDFENLSLSDQLKIELDKGITWRGFAEGPLTFAPTYRFDLGTDMYDTSEKKRKPAWCDRILFLSNDLKQYNYKSGPLLTSDHKPVSSVFGIPVKIIDKTKRKAIIAELTQNSGTEINLPEDNNNNNNENAEQQTTEAATPNVPVVPAPTATEPAQTQKVPEATEQQPHKDGTPIHITPEETATSQQPDTATHPEQAKVQQPVEEEAHAIQSSATTEAVVTSSKPSSPIKDNLMDFTPSPTHTVSTEKTVADETHKSEDVSLIDNTKSEENALPLKTPPLEPQKIENHPQAQEPVGPVLEDLLHLTPSPSPSVPVIPSHAHPSVMDLIDEPISEESDSKEVLLAPSSNSQSEEQKQNALQKNTTQPKAPEPDVGSDTEDASHFSIE